jgi:formylglycine-generating enzyme required for sulfatase activity
MRFAISSWQRSTATRTWTAALCALPLLVAACASAPPADAPADDAGAPGDASAATDAAPTNDATDGETTPLPSDASVPNDAPSDTSAHVSSLGIELRALAGGTFTMGSPANVGHAEEHPAHVVTLSPFSIARTEITFAQWSAIVAWAKGHGYVFDTTGTAGVNPVAPVEQNPVTDVTWWDAVRACNALSEMEGRTPAYYLDAAHTQVFRGAGQPDFGNEVVIWHGAGYRLPTEAEWEYAYRGGTTTEFWWGDAFDASKEWVDPTNGCAQPSHPVGTKVANPYGLYDIGGNVHEMVWDAWPSPYAAGAITDPRGAGAGGWARVTRGGNLCYDADYARAAYRRGVSPSYTQDFDEGLRVVLP